MQDKQKSKFQMIWGVSLVLAGIGVLYRIPLIMPKIKEIPQFASFIFIYFIYFCFYLLAILLIAGGGKKVYNYFKKSNSDSQG